MGSEGGNGNYTHYKQHTFSLLPTHENAINRSADCIMLTHIALQALSVPSGTTSFTIEALKAVRKWAKARHVYGTRFGYPGNSDSIDISILSE